MSILVSQCWICSTVYSFFLFLVHFLVHTLRLLSMPVGHVSSLVSWLPFFSVIVYWKWCSLEFQSTFKLNCRNLVVQQCHTTLSIVVLLPANLALTCWSELQQGCPVSDIQMKCLFSSHIFYVALCIRWRENILSQAKRTQGANEICHNCR